MNINRNDIFWNYASIVLKILSGILLLPFVLNMMSTEAVGIWIVFTSITAFSSLLDFGFNNSFTRNVTYIFSGVDKLKTQGYEAILIENKPVDYGLLKGCIKAMRWFYLRLSILLFCLLSSIGTWYVYSILQKYHGEKQDIYIAWFLLCAVNTYNIYTLYYSALLQGKGLIKRSKQILIVGQLIYIGIAAFFIFLGFGLVAIVCAQATSVIITRWISYRFFFTDHILKSLKEAKERSRNEILKVIYPNALKVGGTIVGKFLIQKSAIIIGSLYLTLEDIASYGITLQLISIIATLASVYLSTFYPKIAHLRVKNEKDSIKEYYVRGQIILVLTFLTGGIGLLLIGDWMMDLINSKTHLMSFWLIVFALMLSFEQTNLSMASAILLTKNEVPFYKTYLISGVLVVIGLFLVFKFLDFGLLTLLIVPLLVDVSSQAWKWPLAVKRELNVQLLDYSKVLNKLRKD